MAKKISKKLVALLLTAIMVMAMGVSAFAATDGATYDVGVTLYKDEEGEEVSKGNAGIASMTATYDASDNTYDIVLHTQDITILTYTGTLSSFSLYSKTNGIYMDADKDSTGYYFTINNYPAADLQVGKMIPGKYTTPFSIMGTRTGYLSIDSMTVQAQ